jgi:O-antigen/teichoic acid export membrane protein
VSFGVSLTTIFMLSRFVNSSNTVVIAAFQPIEAVTFFAIAWTLCAHAIESAKSLSYLMSPRVSALVSIGSDRVAEEVLRVGKLSTLIVAPMAITFLLRGESFITLWMGAEYGPVSGEVLQILALAVWLEASRSVAIHSLAGMAKQRTLVLGVAVEAACSLALSIVLVRHLGIVGVALGATIPGLLMNLGYIPRRLSRAAGFSVTRYYRDVVLLPTLSCGPFALASAATEHFVPATNLAAFFAQVIAILPLVPLTAWFLSLTAEEKRQVRLRLEKRVGA